MAATGPDSPLSAPQSASSPTKKAQNKRPVTRYGVVSNCQPVFAKEERFSWQKPKFSTDCVYDLMDSPNTRNVLFGTSLRKPLNEAGTKSSTGPGSYEFMPCYDHCSGYKKLYGNKFAQAPRQSMAVKTPSPGAVYDLGQAYYRGPEKKKGLGFANSTRGELYGKSTSTDADLYMPKTDYGYGITMAGRPKQKTLNHSTPGAVYDVHKVVNFQTGPSFSFGKGKGNRFSNFGYLPEPDNW